MSGIDVTGVFNNWYRCHWVLHRVVYHCCDAKPQIIDRKRDELAHETGKLFAMKDALARQQKHTEFDRNDVANAVSGIDAQRHHLTVRLTCPSTRRYPFAEVSGACIAGNKQKNMIRG